MCLLFFIGESLTRESLLAKKALNKRHILATKTSKCKCQQNCLGQFSARDIFNLRERYWSKSRQAQAQFLVHSASMKVRNGRFTYIRLDTGKEVCQRAFCSLLRVNKNALTSARKQSKRDAKAGTTKSEKTISKKVIQTMNWFEDFAKVYGDRMPNTKDILLPYKTRKVCVFEKYKSDILVSDQISKTMFFTMWKERFPYLKIKEVSIINLLFSAAVCLFLYIHSQVKSSVSQKEFLPFFPKCVWYLTTANRQN